MAKINTKSLVYKDRTGQAWFFGIYSNNFADREEEIFSWKSHLDYAQWIKDKGIKLPITVAHQPKYPSEVHAALLFGLMTGHFSAEEFSDSYMKLYKPYAFAQTEAVIPVNGFTLVVGKILKDKEDAVKLLSNSGWGMSHGYLALDRDPQDSKVIDLYRTFEFTVLPPAMAANQITAISIKEIFEMDAFKALGEEDRQKLQTLLKADPADLEEGLGEFQRILSQFIDTKEMDEPETAEPEAYEEIRDKIFADMGVEQLSKSFTQMAETLQALVTRVDALEPRVKATERSEDEKIAAAFNPLQWDLFAKDMEETDSELLDNLKENALGERPIEGAKGTNNTDNPLVLGWIGPMGFNR